MLVISILVVVVVIAAVAVTILFDMLTEKDYRVLVTLRQWQTLVGAILGFVTGAGIIAISTEVQNDSERLREAEQLKRVGEALFTEAKMLDTVLARAELMRAVFSAGNGTCTSDVLELTHTFQRETPIYDVAIPHFVEVGAENLSLFVNFYGTFGELERDLASYVSASCVAPRPDVETLVFEKIASARKAFTAIAAQYSTGTP